MHCWSMPTARSAFHMHCCCEQCYQHDGLLVLVIIFGLVCWFMKERSCLLSDIAFGGLNPRLACTLWLQQQ
jgi:hypothetical protein